MTSTSWLSQKQYYSVQFHAFAKSTHQILKILIHACIYHNMNQDISVTRTSHSQISLQATNCLIQALCNACFIQLFVGSAARKALKLTIIVTLGCWWKYARTRTLECPIGPVTKKALIQIALSKQEYDKATLHSPLPVLGPICCPSLCWMRPPHGWCSALCHFFYPELFQTNSGSLRQVADGKGGKVCR